MGFGRRWTLALTLALLGWATTARALPDIAPQIGDVSIDPDSTVDPGDVVEGCAGAQTGRTLLNFSIRTLSLGPDDLVMGDPGCPDCSTNPGAACANPLYECSEAHGHPHFEGFARAELLDADDNVLVTGHKQGFCLLDLDCPIGITPQFDCGYQGITTGCSDVYDVGLPCQYIDITDVPLPDGDYRLRVTLDDQNEIAEANETNNVAIVTMHIGTPPPPPPTTCPVYVASNLPTPIPDLGAAVSTIHTSRAGAVTRLRVVDLRGVHTYTSDLRFVLQAPSTSSIELMRYLCGDEDDFDLDLADAGYATYPIPCPLTGGGLYVSTPMGSFVGEPGTGDWTLTISDEAGVDSGRLDAWGLEVCTTCGNGVLDAGETCDDGNASDGDCCSSDCQTVAADGTSCSDPLQCTIDGTCQSGGCTGTVSGCDPCLTCEAGLGCVPPAHVLCDTEVPRRSAVRLAKGSSASHDDVSWSWTARAPVALLDFGNPSVVTDLTMCVYDQSGLKLSATAPHAGTCAGKPCWTATASSFRYRNPLLAPDGILKIAAKAGDAGQARIRVKGKGANLGLPGLGMQGTVTMRLKRSGGPARWQAHFPTATAIRNEATQFKAKVD